jgi:TatD DNase family protein
LRLVDSHGHLQADRFAPDVELVVGAARLAGVERLLVPGWDPESSVAALGLVDRFRWLDAAVGVHPHEAAAVDDVGWSRIVALADDPRVKAIGETGLDSDRGFSPLDAQLANLRRNLALAAATGKPAILHCRSRPGERDSQDRLVAELRSAGFGGPDMRRAFGDRPPAIVHSFSGPEDYAETVLGLGLAISFSGLVFRAAEESSAAVARLVPVDRLLVETDAPFLSPPGAPRKRNAPEWVGLTAGWLAEQRGEDPELIGDRLVAAYDHVLGRPAEQPSPDRAEGHVDAGR